MSILLDKKKGKYRFWQTISDEWCSDWLTEKEAIKFYEDIIKQRAKREILELRERFPFGFSNRNLRRYPFKAKDYV